MSNGDFWKKIRQGDEGAFQMLYNQYADLLYGYGMKIVMNNDLVTDSIQTLFVYIFEKRDKLSEPVSIPAYLCVSLRRLILQQQKQGDRKNTSSIDDVTERAYSFNLELDAESAIIHQEDNETKLGNLQKYLDTLTSQQREVIYLKYYQGLKTEAISQMLGITGQTVRNTASMALTRLRECVRMIILLFR